MPTKAVWRKSIMTLLADTKSVECCNRAGIQIASRLGATPAYKTAQRVSVFISRFPEIDSVPCIDALFNDAKQVFIPTWLGGDMKMVEMTDKAHVHQLLSTRKSRTHIPRPQFDPAAPIESVDLCIIPGLLFDRFGGRIGYGFGHYDKYLSEHLSRYNRLPHLIAVCHDEQIVDMTIPTEEHDVSVNMVVTPTKDFTMIKI
jgi:5-formyltetrahydrofolate cyclo-ligase